MPATRDQVRVPWWSDEAMYWLEDQVAVVFQSNLSLSQETDLSSTKGTIIASLNLDNLNQFLKVRGLMLQSFSPGDVAHPLSEAAVNPHREEIEALEREIEEYEEEIEKLKSLNHGQGGPAGYKSPRQREIEALEANVEELENEIGRLEHEGQDSSSPDTSGGLPRRSRPSNNLDSTTGKYLFPLSHNEGTLVVGFFNVKSARTLHQTQDIPTLRVVRRGGQDRCGEQNSNTRKAIDLINSNLEILQREAKVPVMAASPNWLGGANCYTHGCPAYPPFPVPENDTCYNADGFWPIQIPALLSETSPLRDMTGKDVTMFVLDSMPDLKHDPAVIQNAANRAGQSNKLLRKIADQQDRALSPFIKFHYRDLPDQLKEDAADQIVTGRDINGRIYGFRMSDHGLFVAGIIRDLAPDADIEYVRVLNDFGVGSTADLIKALEDIQGRMAPSTASSEAGDLYQKPVVVNLSLVVTPSDENLLQVWYGMDPPHMASSHALMKELPEEMRADMELLRAPIGKAIECLAASGAVIVASAGNDSHRPDMPGRVNPRYPAAFEQVIAVGAVDSNGHAAIYSNYPQLSPHTNGIATYGGSIPTLTEIHTDTGIDAMRGVYSETLYPAPVAENPPLPDYDPHDPTGWAYWSGTSFATPIISAVAARVLQSQQGVWMAHEYVPGVHRAITTPEGQKQYVTGNAALPLQQDFGNGVHMLKAYQCVGGVGGEAQEEVRVEEGIVVTD